ncbi:MAG: transposase [Candidatus Pacebacteria bacterium]|jgi:putative transposase|nr:transposase [Candidatus Paceibacterota bacterium]|tara:strand:+ start:36 stop:698 length:663 start_codon:yes stop_codon:yes gene_type:complete
MNRVAVGDTVYHVINRANGRATIFKSKKDYQHFESLLGEGKQLVGMRILSYCIMPNHWHLVLYPKKNTDMGEFMRWVTTTHVRQRHSQTESIGYGHLYQGTYKSFPVESDKHLIDLIRYVEQNPLRAKLVKRAENWQFSSLWRREKGTSTQQKLLSKLPTALPNNYIESVNQILNKEVLETLRNSVNKGTPLGSSKWTKRMVEKYCMGSTLREPGRPKSA